MRSYPRTRFDIVNNTSISEIETSTMSGTTSIMMAAYTSDKGSEDWELLYGLTDFTTRKGGLNFTKHGQSQFTVANLLKSGSYVLAKRMVSDDATLANVTVRARVVVVDGVSYVYLYTTTETDAKKFTDACNPSEVSSLPEGTTDYALFTIAALGRGASALTFRLVPEFYASKASNYMKYTLEISENVQVLESIICTFNPDAIENSTIQSIENKANTQSGQVKAKIYEDQILEFTKKLAETASYMKETSEGPVKTSYTLAELVNMDYVNGFTKKEKAIAGIVTKNVANATGTSSEVKNLWVTNKPSDIKAVSLYDANGIKLLSGTNGAMGNAPISNTAEYKKMLLATYGAGTGANFSPVIYDVERYKVDAIFDCNYDFDVKNAIVDLVDFRGDLVFLADLGIGLTDLDSIISAADKIKNSKYVAIYHNSFDIIDQFTKKQITVTMPYLLAPKLVDHINTGVGKAFAGMSNNLSFPEIIESSINMIPIIIPGLDQKQELADHSINYICYYDDTAVMDTMWNNDDANTQLSYLHNVMAIQEIIKVIRTRCPRTRYTFLDGDDLDEYLTDANSVIKEYSTNFKSIAMTYMADEKYESNNIFYATIVVQFHNFVNEEYFKVIAIDSSVN